MNPLPSAYLGVNHNSVSIQDSGSMIASVFSLRPEQDPDRVIVEDDFSVKIESRGDRMFWLRALRDQGDQLVISDFKRSMQSDTFSSAAIVEAINVLGLWNTCGEIRFLDIVPRSKNLDEAQSEAAVLAKLASEAFTRHGWELDEPQLTMTGTKFNFSLQIRR